MDFRDARTASARRLGLFVLLALAVLRPSSVGLAQSAPPPLVIWQGLIDNVSPGNASPVLNADADYDTRAISADGRFVAFRSGAYDVVSGDWNWSDDVFLRDRMTRTTERVSLDVNGNEAYGWSGQPSSAPTRVRLASTPSRRRAYRRRTTPSRSPAAR